MWRYSGVCTKGMKLPSIWKGSRVANVRPWKHDPSYHESVRSAFDRQRARSPALVRAQCDDVTLCRCMSARN
jgi:hypothetical protein